MSLNKKQKKQIEVAQAKLTRLRLLLGNARKQPDDLAEIAKLDKEVRELETLLEQMRHAG